MLVEGRKMRLSKLILWGMIIILVAGLIFYSLGYKITPSAIKSGAGGKGNIPNECQPPTGQDLASWKEHLGHHQETKYCLQYFK